MNVIYVTKFGKGKFCGSSREFDTFLEFTTNLYSSYVVVDDNTKRSESKRMLNTECEARFFSVGGWRKHTLHLQSYVLVQPEI